MEDSGRYPVLPAPECPKCEKGHLLLRSIEHGSIRSDFRYTCSNPDCDHYI